MSSSCDKTAATYVNLFGISKAGSHVLFLIFFLVLLRAVEVVFLLTKTENVYWKQKWFVHEMNMTRWILILQVAKKRSVSEYQVVWEKANIYK